MSEPVHAPRRGTAYPPRQAGLTGRRRIAGVALAVAAALVFTLLSATPAQAAGLDGVFHDPHGADELYATEPTERAPRDPMAGENVTVRATTWPIASGQSVWVTWSLNGVTQTPKGAAYDYNSGNNTYWRLELGTFARGDVVEYTVNADVNGSGQKSTGSFSFATTSWSTVTNVVSYVDNGTSIDIVTGDSAGDFTPKVRFAFPRLDGFDVQIAPNGAGLDLSGVSGYSVTDGSSQLTISTSELVLRIDKNPYRLSVYKGDGTTLITRQYDPATFRNIGWASDGATTVTKIEDHYLTPTGERFEGFGERYDRLDHRGTDVHNYVYNQYQDQGATRRTYYSVPYFANSAGYGVHVPSTRYAIFNLATYRTDMAGFTVDTGGALDSTLTYQIFTGDQTAMLDDYTAETGRPLLPPKWAFGLWGSANEWNTQAEVDAWLAQVENSGIPHSALVLEQWSDEATFYLWKDAQYTPAAGSGALDYNDLTFPTGGAWSDPEQMIADAHDQNIRVILWQIPVLKESFTSNPSEAPQQHINDKAYAQSQGYLVEDGAGQPYRIPTGQWFGDSTVPDFTSAAATDWWMNKRQYLLDLGVDGFKTDGSEALFGRDLQVADGRRGDEMHNAYPNEYTRAYNDYVQQETGGDGTIFSRAGTSGGQSQSIFWAGDQASTFGAFQEAVRAGLSAGQSGVPFWAWDLAGFTGSFPTAELYLRSTSQAAFSPIMQYHSEKSDPSPSEARTPWNVQSRTGNTSVVPTFAKFANVRMNLIPYLYTEADDSATTGVPMMRAMSLAFPGDAAAAGSDQQYMFGSQLLVAPITTQGQTVKDVYLPEGEWYDFWNGGPATGAGVKQYYAGTDGIPVYAKAGAVIPLNLNDAYELGGTIGNDVDVYDNLAFRIYPAASSSYDYFEDSADAHRAISVASDRVARTVTVSAPPLTAAATYQVSGTKPATVTVAGSTLTEVGSVSALAAAGTGWYWDAVQQLTFVKVGMSTATRLIVLNGVDKAAYEAEFATQTAVNTNTDHPGYTGDGFVDGFATNGDAVQFDVWADASATHQLRFRYSNGAATAAVRTVRVDGTVVDTLSLPSSGGSWDQWTTASIAASLSPGRHTVRIEYGSDSSGGINLDNLVLAR
ncbi:alpha-glucosidase (family GH31 glycosyl hydrolase) [Microbacterium halimionae]|uniref:Alpha-glucosidase (Family GH31 glycosyl hydrolase) n=1 Tax=Microbacterium halimionae TaxID=1526413 RepID=A0A7W3JMZ8_9MICO|nr:TIM-barrel domain-containing protein [Microbacterium halimionae]MBA8815813.1 alpha-glucosidase (family GH31 glycosyl hydrolase) [Microbacterium halimionae]NII95859.1 alpha-glucosidase (family GH31 glycosyl hydrolase) [Microbacterium halimionae]